MSRGRESGPASAVVVACNVLVSYVAALVLASCAADARSTALVGLAPDEAVVERVVDGDTVRVRRPDGGRESVRLIGIDTPESTRPGTEVECFAKEAAAYLATLLPTGAVVRLERDVELRDRYGRLLAYVHRRSDDLFVNLALAERGFARLSTHPPNVAYVDRFAAAVADARADHRGLWARCAAAGDARGPPHATVPV